MKLEDLGYTEELETFRLQQKLDDFVPGRVLEEHKERYLVGTERGEFEAEVTGNLRFTAESREDYPAVGDWVALTLYGNETAIIHQLFPRFSVLKRKSAGPSGGVQLIAANVDFAFIVQAADRDFNVNRLERYLTVCYAAKVNPIVLLSKIDLSKQERVNEMIKIMEQRMKKVPFVCISNETREGYQAVKKLIVKGKTYCLLGSSGVGKSTLLNNLKGGMIMQTGPISEYTGKGKHITSHRELVVLEGGGMIIDNPGMREIGIAETAEGLETTFEPIERLSRNCRFKDCTHTSESGCAVMEAVEAGEIDQKSYRNYLKLEREKAFFESTMEQRKRKEKTLGKILKHYKKMDGKQKK